MDRKDFLLKGCALCGVAATLTFIDSCSKDNSNVVNFTLDLSSSANATLNNTGGYVIQNNVIVMRTSSGFKALSLVCTHQGCTVNYSNQQFYCPCHGGSYDQNGNVLSGPPPSPLKSLTVSQSGNILTVHS